MRKVIAAINMSLDGFFGHTQMSADEEIHQHYSDLINGADAILFGRITYQLMEYWPTVLKNPTGNKAMDDFAVAIDRIPKIVFSHTLKDIEWKTARLATKAPAVEVNELKQQPGRDIYVGSRSVIIALLNQGLIDELQLVVHPVILGNGPRLFEPIERQIDMKLTRTKFFKSSGASLFCYEPTKKN